jgi:hypothetical protein
LAAYVGGCEELEVHRLAGALHTVTPSGKPWLFLREQPEPQIFECQLSLHGQSFGGFGVGLRFATATGMRNYLLFACVLSGCTAPLNGGNCSDHKDQASCVADSGCAAQTCPGICGGAPTFQECVDANSNKTAPSICVLPEIACPQPCSTLSQTECAAEPRCQVFECCGYRGCYDAGTPMGCAADCINCDGLDEAGCLATSGYCTANYCSDCSGLKSTFSGCTNPGEPPLICELPACQPSCDQLVDETSCNSRSDCHSVYEPGNACACAGAGCCIFFNHCASGPAECSGTVTCRAQPPECGGQYVLGYTGTCYEGCVLATACP